MAQPGTLTTHVLDTAHGRPADGLRIDLYRIGDHERDMLSHVVTNADGRTPHPMIPAGELAPGTYELVFHVGSYFADSGLELEGPRFLDLVPVRFVVSDTEQGFHVPLLVSPYGYSTYRGS